MAQWAPVIVALIAAGLAIPTYMFQKIRERREELIKLRRAEYRNWLRVFYNAVQGEIDGHKPLNTATNDLFLYGSDNVVIAAGKFVKYLADTSPGRKPRDVVVATQMLANVVREMRQDCFDKKSELTNDAICRMLPIEGA